MSTLSEIGKSNEAILTWATKAAEEHVNMCVYNGEDPDPEWDMGLWQSFQHDFPKDSVVGDYDLALWLASTTYKNVVDVLGRAHGVAA